MTTDALDTDTGVIEAPAPIATHALGAFTGEVAFGQYTLARSVSRTMPQLRHQSGARSDALCYLRRACTDRARRRLAQRLALQLARWHGIPWPETSLVPWLTREHCRDNGAALVRWALQEMGTCDAELWATENGADRLLATLSASLGRVLADVAEPQP